MLPHAITIDQVSKRFPNGVQAVDGVSLAIPTGQFVAILGPSGCGKSTLLRMIAKLESPTVGTVKVSTAAQANETNDHVLSYRRAAHAQADIAYVFQDAHLLPWRNVARNVALPLELLKLPRDGDVIDDVLRRVGLADVGHLYPSQLSGGMRMRVSLARALVTKPKLLLLDEPFAALDEITRHQLDEQLRTLWQQSGMTVVFVTHSIMEATFLAERAIVMTRRPGRIAIDHALALPAQRDSQLRGTPEFARAMGTLLAALTAGAGQAVA